MSARSLFIVAAISIAVRVAALWLVDGPGYLDASYSLVVGQRLAAGEGLTEPFIWHWLRIPAEIVRPAGDYWPPGEAFLVAVSSLLFGPSFRAAQIPNLLCAAAIPLLAVLEARRVSLSATSTRFAVVLAIASGPYFARWSTTDAFAPFAVAGAVSLYLSSLFFNRNRGSAFLSGLAAGFAQLFRADGFLLIAAGVLRPRFPAILFAFAGFLIAAAPFAARSFVEFGGQSGIRSIWLAGYNDIFRPGGTPFAEWIALGPLEIVRIRIVAGYENLLTIAELPGWLLLPAAIVGVIKAGEHFRPHLRYLGVLWVAMTVLFPYPSLHGALAHSLASLLPAACVLSALGLEAEIDWFSARRGWDRARARISFGSKLVAGSAVASLGIALQLAGGWNDWNRVQRGIAGKIRATEANAIVATADPATLGYYLRRPAVVLPNIPLDQALPLLRSYEVSLAVVGPEIPAAWVEPFSNGKTPPGLTEIDGFERYRIFRILP